MRNTSWIASPDVLTLTMCWVGNYGKVLRNSVFRSGTDDIPVGDNRKTTYKFFSLIFTVAMKL